MTAVSIVELLAYAIIGLAALLIVGGVSFLIAIYLYERIEAWRVNAKAGVHGKQGPPGGRSRFKLVSAGEKLDSPPRATELGPSIAITATVLDSQEQPK